VSKQAVLGVDVGGTKTLCLLVNNRRQIVAESKFKTAGGEGCDVFSRNLLKELKALAERAQKQRLELVGIGVDGRSQARYYQNIPQLALPGGISRSEIAPARLEAARSFG
jgi:predicted NBD/HSP70 family sugar kinase